MKSFKNFVAEVAQPKPEEEKRFKDQHTYEVIKHPVATDAQFTGDIDKPKAKRIADQEGDANYDKAVKNPEKRMAAESVKLEEGSYEKAAYGKGDAYDRSEAHDEAARDHEMTAKKWEKKQNYRKAEAHQDAAKLHQKAAAAYDKIHMRRSNKSGPFVALPTTKSRAAHAASIAAGPHNESFELAEKESLDEMLPSVSNILKNRQQTAQKGSNLDKKREAGMNAARNRMSNRTNEEAEQIDEISKELAARYIKKAQVSSADAGMDTASQDKNIRQRGIKTFLKRRKGVDSAVKRLMQRDESMADDRARYDAADDKNKKKVTLPKAPWDKKDEELSPKQKKIDANKNGKIDGHDLAMLRSKKKNEEVELDETTSSAMKKMVTQTGPDGKTRTVMKKAKADKMDDRGQDQITTRESVELDEAVKVKKGPLRLKDGSQIMVTKEDADLLSRMFSDLSPNNQRQMQKVMMMDKAGFEEIRGFAREAL